LPSPGDVLSFWTVPDSLPVRPGVNIPLEEVELRTSRSSGPGGQHANVTASRVEAVFDVGASATLSDAQKARITARLGPRVTASAQDTRSQLRNRELALERLASRLAHALEVRRPRRATRPTKASKQRRVDAKKRRGDIKRARRKPDL
jgi:ribosome-associated protein